ncbi:hypothetical protein CRUP_029933 [Coryphaenoides rupestris]|nr:hypothetical protein CRUP_029933 [Coryphaenoides rupestris]
MTHNPKPSCFSNHQHPSHHHHHTIWRQRWQDINRKVEEGPPRTHCQALQAPGASLRGVLSECADSYQTDLARGHRSPTPPPPICRRWPQACLKGSKQRKLYKDRMTVLQGNVGSVVKEKEIVKIQAFLKANKTREDYRTLTGAQDPPLSVVRKFVHLLEQSSLRPAGGAGSDAPAGGSGHQDPVQSADEKDLNLMDIKIGLLGLSKDKRKKLEAYQHLFYLLQTNPSYLAKLIFQMPQNKSTKFMDTVIFTLYNYASNQREDSKVDQIQDIVTGNPTVIKMVVSFNRGARGQNTLRQLLAPVVKDIIEDKTLGINTNPVDVYKAWVNQLETATGEASKLPYEVTPEQAMAHQEVRGRLEASSQALPLGHRQGPAPPSCPRWTTSRKSQGYGMRYIAKVLKNSLHAKFPEATEDELLKIVSNLLYYRYMNPAIVAPDGFDIIDMSAGGQLHPDQRRNLGSVAKMLQHAAANKLFEGETHMTPMNHYISQTYEKFRQFFQAACDVPEPEEKFNVDEYSDMVTLSKPIIYISIEEIINTHSLLLEHLGVIGPDRTDLLHELLQDLGEVPDVEALLGEGAVDPNETNREVALSQLAKTEISLTLTSKFELLEGEDQDLKTLMTKYVVSVATAKLFIESWG